MENLKIDEKQTGLFQHYYVDVFLKHYADFSGKISRKQFWMAYLFNTLVYILFYGLGLLVNFPYLMLVYLLVMLVPTIAFTVRRLHDIGKSGWWYLIGLVPLVGAIWLLVLLCKKGDTTDISVRGKVIDWIVLALIIILSVVGIVIGTQRLSKNIESALNEQITNAMLQADTELGTPTDESDEGEQEFESDIVLPEESFYNGGVKIGASTSGRYEYYLKKEENVLYQFDTESGMTYTLKLKEISEDIVVSSIEDYTIEGNKIVFITNNGATGMSNGYDAFYFDMDNENWTYIGFAKYIQFNNDKSVLQAANPTDESMENFEKQEIKLSDI